MAGVPNQKKITKEGEITKKKIKKRIMNQKRYEKTEK